MQEEQNHCVSFKERHLSTQQLVAISPLKNDVLSLPTPLPTQQSILRAYHFTHTISQPSSAPLPFSATSISVNSNTNFLLLTYVLSEFGHVSRLTSTIFV